MVKINKKNGLMSELGMKNECSGNKMKMKNECIKKEKENMTQIINTIINIFFI